MFVVLAQNPDNNFPLFFHDSLTGLHHELGAVFDAHASFHNREKYAQNLGPWCGPLLGWSTCTYLPFLYTICDCLYLQDYKELSMPLSQIPVNMHTASELLRLSLRHDDQQDNDDRNSSNGSEDYINEDDVVSRNQS